jgi:hypothetical protein
MNYVIAEGTLPYQWRSFEAFASGRTAYRIGVDLINNPFKKSPFLSDEWTKGYNEAAASDTTSTRRIDYLAEENYDRRPKSRPHRGDKSFGRSGTRTGHK